MIDTKSYVNPKGRYSEPSDSTPDNVAAHESARAEPSSKPGAATRRSPGKAASTAAKQKALKKRGGNELADPAAPAVNVAGRRPNDIQMGFEERIRGVQR